VLFPLFGQHEDLLEKSWSLSLIGFPEGFSLMEFGGSDKLDKRSERLLIFYHSREKDDYRTVFFPLWWQRSSPDYSRSQVFPLYAWRRDAVEGERRFGLIGFSPKWSLFSWSDTPLETTHRLWPLYGWGKDKKEHESYFGFLGFHRKASLFLSESGPDEVHHRLFPIYGYERRGDPGTGGYHRETAVLWRLYYHELNGTDESDWRILYRFVRSYRSKDETAFEVNPFYFKVTKGPSRYWAILGGLFGVETKPDGSHSYTFLWIL
jgi:hypothetical protein